MKPQAIIFDCDGVLVDTERDGHRVAFNNAFSLFGIEVTWSPVMYKHLVRVAGGKERMRSYFNEHGWPLEYSDKDLLIKELHLKKTAIFMDLIEEGKLPLRPGVMRLIDEAIDNNITLAVCSTSNEKSVNLIVKSLLGAERKAYFGAILAGDVVSRKKPDPEIYNLCQSSLNLDPSRCVVIEDNRNGLLAAKGAGFRCLVTTNAYTLEEDFREADRVVPELGDEPTVQVDINTINQIITA